jgi:hypothetical protein
MEQERFRETIGREIKRQLNGEIRTGLPAILGTRDPIRVKEELEKSGVKKDDPVYAKNYAAKMANLKVAEVANHKRKIPPTFDERLGKKETRLKELEAQLAQKKAEGKRTEITWRQFDDRVNQFANASSEKESRRAIKELSAASTPRFLAMETPRLSCRRYLTRGSGKFCTIRGPSSVDPSSTTITRFISPRPALMREKSGCSLPAT